MPVIIPTNPEHLLYGLVAVALIVGIAIIWNRIFPPAIDKLLPDSRYQEALGVYAAKLANTDPSRDDRRAALQEATTYLIDNHDIPARRAKRNMRRMQAFYDREQSDGFRDTAFAYEEAGDYESALLNFQRAARWQKDHNRAAYDFLRRCAARVERKARRATGHRD
jgi:hypothetical protein